MDFVCTDVGANVALWSPSEFLFFCNQVIVVLLHSLLLSNEEEDGDVEVDVVV